MQSISKRLPALVVVAALGAALGACAAATVNKNNAALVAYDSNSPAATVYFIRPEPFKYKGIADNLVTIEYQGEKLLDINEGQYVMVKLTPSEGDIITRSTTKFTNQQLPIEVTRNRRYKFIAGDTYFIYLKRIDEEFRGIFYDPAPVDLNEAKQLAKDLSVQGDAKNAPIASLQAVPDSPLPSMLKPAFPEDLYLGVPYMVQETPQYVAPAPANNEISFDAPPKKRVDRTVQTPPPTTDDAGNANNSAKSGDQ